MGVVVSFNYQNWVQKFPELSNVNSALANSYFTMATAYCRNDGGGPVNDPNVKQQMLDFLTAHIAFLFSPQNSGQPNTTGSDPAPNMVGRISSANEGSVSVSIEMPMNASDAWFKQTRYGAAYWQLTMPYRTMRYVRRRQRSFEPWPWAGSWLVGGTLTSNF